MAAEKIGRITQVIGAVLDIRFQEGELPRSMRRSGFSRRTAASWLPKFPSIWETTRSDVLPWVRQTDCAEEWKQSQPALRSVFR